LSYFHAESVERHIRRKHPGCPDFAVAFFVGEIVGRDWKKASIGMAVGITMQTILRHRMTDYDHLLMIGVDREDARRRVQPKINAMIQSWSRKPT
jgi:hypothetical protein